MDCGPHFYCDGHIVSFPNTFRVRKYNNSLDYLTHNVIRYATMHTHTFVYRMMRSTEEVVVRVTDSDIVAQNDRLRAHKYMHFPPSTHIKNIVCEMLTKPDSLVVLDTNSDSVEQTLF
nr:MAG TPA: hypothetical protein [Bacteriophage sp.]